MAFKGPFQPKIFNGSLAVRLQGKVSPWPTMVLAALFSSSGLSWPRGRVACVWAAIEECAEFGFLEGTAYLSEHLLPNTVFMDVCSTHFLSNSPRDPLGTLLLL